MDANGSLWGVFGAHKFNCGELVSSINKKITSLSYSFGVIKYLEFLKRHYILQ